MGDTTARTLKLLGLLQAHRLWAATELAERLETTERTVRRDVERLRELGYPVESVRGAGGGYQLAPGGSLPPLVVDEEESVAIVAALHNAATGPAAGLAEASVRALAKVTQVLPPKLRRRAEALVSVSVTLSPRATPPLAAEALTTVALACRDSVELEFDYAPAARDGRVAGHRRTEPLRLVPFGPRWYLVAYDLDRADWRTFRLDRLTEPTTGKRSFRPRELPGGDAAEYVRANLRPPRDVHEVVAIVRQSPEQVRGRIGRWAEVVEHPGGTEITMRVADSRWVTSALAYLEADYEFARIPEQLLTELRSRNARESRALFLAEQRSFGD